MGTEHLFFKSSPIHGTGAFARHAISAGTRVIDYVGERIDKTESVRRCAANNHCIFSLGAAHDLDGAVEWNPARFINHSCDPNCDALCESERIWIVANRDIAAGEEVTFNYTYDLEDYRKYACNCGSPSCVGYIVAEEFFEHVREQTRVRTTYNSVTQSE